MKRFTFLILVLAISLACHGQTVVHSFDGDVGAGTSSNPDHPNPYADSNGTYVVSVTWQNFLISNYSGTPISTTGILTFLSNAGFTCTYPAATEVRVIYDRFISRWIVVTNCDGPKDLFIVSSGSDPTTSTWKGVALQVSPGADPTLKIAYDKNWVAVTESTPACGPTTATEILLPQADAAWSGGGNVSLTHEVIGTCHTFEAIPCMDTNASKGTTAPFYFVSRVGQTQTQTNAALTLAVDTFTPTSATAGTLSAAGSPTTITTPYLYNTPVDPAQPGSPSGVRGAESHRGYSCTSTNSTDMQLVWSTGPCSTSGTCNSETVNTHQHTDWFDVATPALTLIQSAKIFSTSIDYIFPSLGLDSSNNTAIVATGCGTSQFCSIYSWTHFASDASGVIHGPTLLTSGTANYQVCNTTPHPGWGDYASTLQDVSNPATVWTIAEYANSSTPCASYTRILDLQLVSPVLPVAPDTTIMARAGAVSE
jgi:hypothetical protein